MQNYQEIMPVGIMLVPEPISANSKYAVTYRTPDGSIKKVLMPMTMTDCYIYPHHDFVFNDLVLRKIEFTWFMIDNFYWGVRFSETYKGEYELLPDYSEYTNPQSPHFMGEANKM